VQSGLSCSDQEIPDALAARRAEKERALRARFERDRKDGNLPKSASPAALASYLVTVAHGMSVQAAAGARAKALHDIVEIAMAAWPADEKPAAKRPARVAHAAH